MRRLAALALRTLAVVVALPAVPFAWLAVLVAQWAERLGPTGAAPDQKPQAVMVAPLRLGSDAVAAVMTAHERDVLAGRVRVH